MFEILTLKSRPFQRIMCHVESALCAIMLKWCVVMVVYFELCKQLDYHTCKLDAK